MVHRCGQGVGLLSALLIAIGVLATSANAAPPSPPFSECPAIGADTSCGFLIDITSTSGAPAVYQDQNLGPYDGSDDTLVGVKNDSTSAVASIQLTSGAPVFAFDQDGLCTYVPEPGCPATYGYEGPGVTFTDISNDATSGTVNFSPALQPGQSAYFSLEIALSLVPPNNIVPGPPNSGAYAALGDSYSSGEGLGNYAQGTDLSNNHCHRSTSAYGALLDADESLGAFAFVACSGAVTADITTANNEGNIDAGSGTAVAAQVQALNAGTKLVTLTIGGNDAGFTQVLGWCLFGRVSIFQVYGSAGCSKNQAYQQIEAARLSALSGFGSATDPRGTPIHSILSVLQAIHGAATNAHIYIAGYPLIFGTFKGECGVGSIFASNVPGLGTAQVAAKITSDDAAWIDSLGQQLDAAIHLSAVLASQQGISVTYVDPSPWFNTHRLCDSSTSWIKPLSGAADYKTKQLTSTDPGSFHPTTTGQASGYETAFLAAGFGS